MDKGCPERLAVRLEPSRNVDEKVSPGLLARIDFPLLYFYFAGGAGGIAQYSSELAISTAIFQVPSACLR